MSLVLWISLGLVLLFFLFGIRIVRPTERGLIERLGKYRKFAEAGFHWIIPFIDKIIFVNITERIADVETLDMITKDNLNAKVDLVVYYKVEENEDNVKKSIYNVDDFNYQIVSLAQTTARNVIGDMKFIEVNNKRNILNKKLAESLNSQVKPWGMKIVRVELKEITPPKDVQETMNNIIKASNEKDAAKDFATAAETKADGLKRAAIKDAEGKKESSILKAQGEAEAFNLINESFTGNAQLLKQLEVTEKSLTNNAKVILTEKGISPTIVLGEGVFPIPKKQSKN